MHSSDSATYEGRMSDGRTAASSAATIRFAASGLEIVSPQTPHPMLWPYASLDTAEPLRRGATDVLVTSSELPGATLFVDDTNFVQQLLARSPQTSTASVRWKYAKPGLLVLATLAAVVAATYVFDLSPARSLAGLMSEGTRVRMGQMVVQSMTESRAVCHTDDGRAALDKLTARLSGASGAPTKFNVIVVDWDLMNAFAAPGSQIVLTREIISDSKTPDEIAGVLAHEMGHGLELHPEAGLIRAVGISAALELMSGGNTGTLANVAGLLAQLSYTRVAEREADQHALRILKTAQISPKGLSDFFKRISAMEGEAEAAGDKSKDTTPPGDKEKAPAGQDKAAPGKDQSAATEKKTEEENGFERYLNIDVLRTHPQSSERRRLIDAQPPYDATASLTDGEWQALRGICKNAKDLNKDGKSDKP
jgi:Zn-dependent protease with chaperone function